MRTRSSARDAERNCEDVEELTTEDSEDTEASYWLSAVPANSAVNRRSCGARARLGAARARAVPDARPEADVGHPAAGGRSADRQRVRAPDPRRALQQHRQLPG